MRYEDPETKRKEVMPIYEYQCKACKHTFELFQKISDKPEGKCPKCGEPASRIISQTSFSLKGGGWYKDGYSSTGPSSTKSDGKKSK